MQVASELGYVYSFLEPESTVLMSRPGLVISFRPGSQQYEVNEHVEFMPQAPRFERNDLFVANSVVDQLRALAVRYPNAAPAANVPVTAAAPTTPVTIALAQDAGREAVIVSGSAPPATTLTITAVGRISRDLPDVLLSRTVVTSGQDGSYRESVPLGGLTWRDAQVTFTTSSDAGAPASAKYTIVDPNAKTTLPADNIPRVFY